MLSFKGITELYIDYAQLAFSQEKKNRKEIFQNINSVSPECFPLPFMLSSIFHIFKYALVMLLKQK